jgi:hypothetical protein
VTEEEEVVPCRFGCRAPASGVVWFRDGFCHCHPDPVQALCPQHVRGALDNNPDAVLVAELGRGAGAGDEG